MANLRIYSVEQAVPQISAPSRRWLIEHLRDGTFPGRKIGREWRLTEEDVLTIIDICKNDHHVADAPTGLTPRTQKRTTA